MMGLILGVIGVGLAFAGGTFAMAGAVRRLSIEQRAICWLLAFGLLYVGIDLLPHWLFAVFVGLGVLGAAADHMRRVRGLA